MLVDHPDDIEARRALIVMLVAELGDPVAAQVHLGEQIDDSLRQLVASSQQPPDQCSPIQCLALGRWLRGLSQTASPPARLRLLNESLRYLQQFLAAGPVDHPDIDAAAGDAEACLADLRELFPDDGLALPEGVWIDLLRTAQVQPPAGETVPWERTRGALTCTVQREVGGRIPIDMPGSYDLLVRFVQRRPGGRFMIRFPAGSTSHAFVLNAPAGPGGVDGLARRTMRPSHLRPGDVQTLRLSVRHAGGAVRLIAELDGKPYLAYDEPISNDSSADAGPRPPSAIDIYADGPAEVLWLGLKTRAGQAVLPAVGPLRWRQPQRHRIRADRSWQWVRQVRKGDLLEIAAGGAWSWNGRDRCGPSGDPAGWHGLRGQLPGQGPPFTIGDRRILAIVRDGVLKMEMEDTDRSDNTGAMDVVIHTYARPAQGQAQSQATMPASPPAVRLAALAAADTRSPVSLQTSFHLLFGDVPQRVMASHDPENDLDLSTRLLAVAAVVEPVALQELIAENAFDFAARDPTAFPEAIAAASILSSLSSGRSQTWHERRITMARAYSDLVSSPDEPPSDPALLDALIAGADAHAAARNWTRAQTLYDEAAALAQAVRPTDAPGLKVSSQRAAAGEHLQAKRRQLADQLAAAPDDVAVRRQLILWTLAEMNDAAAAADLTDDALDPTWRKGLSLVSAPVEDLGVQDALELARWYQSLVTDVSPQGRSALLARADAACQVVLASTAPDDAAHQQASEWIRTIDELRRSSDLSGHGHLLRGLWIDLLAGAASQGSTRQWARHGQGVAVFGARRREAAFSTALRPDGDYELKVVVERTAGDGPLVIALPTPDGPYALRLGRTGSEADTPAIAGGQTVDLHVRVARTDDGLEVVATADGKSIPARPAAQAAHPAQPSPAVVAFRANDGTMLIHSAHLRMTSGSAHEIVQLTSPRFARLAVAARESWQDALPLRKGDEIAITAEGVWTAHMGRGQGSVAGADGPARDVMTGERIGYLEGRIGDGPAFEIGAWDRFTTSSDGMLQLQMHDDDRSDNAGRVTVTIRILGRATPAPQRP